MFLYERIALITHSVVAFVIAGLLFFNSAAIYGDPIDIVVISVVALSGLTSFVALILNCRGVNTQ